MIAISGAAKMPFVALTLNGFLNDLQEEAYNSDNMFNVIVDQDYVTFHDQDSNANDAQEEHAREPLMYVVRLAGSTDDARSSLFKSLQDAEIEFTAGSATIPSAFPPTLLVWGEANRVLPLAGGRALAASLRPHRFATVPGGGHLLMHENFVDANRIMEGFVDAVTAAKPAHPHRA